MRDSIHECTKPKDAVYVKALKVMNMILVSKMHEDTQLKQLRKQARRVAYPE
jgi:hypothetical protein